MRAQSISFTGASGSQRTAALHFPPDNRPQAYAIFAHHLAPGSDAASNISLALNDFGVAVLLVDCVDDAAVLRVDDVLAAADALARDFDAPTLLIGHSVAAIAVIHAARELDSVRAVATIGAPSSRRRLESIMDRRPDGATIVRLPERELELADDVLQAVDDAAMNAAVSGLRRPLIVFHSPVDRTILIDNAQELYQCARHPKSYVSLDQADHQLTDSDDSRYLALMLSAWTRRYLDIKPESTVYADVRDNRVSARTGPTGYRTEIIANGYPLIADEPVALGGTDMGPTPYDFLAAALGACTSMTLRMYADHKKLPLESVTTRVRHTRIHVKDCEDCPDEGRRLDRLEREIELEGDLTDAQRERMVEIANRCPVHRTLTSEVQITTELATEAVAIADKM